MVSRPAARPRIPTRPRVPREPGPRRSASSTGNRLDAGAINERTVAGRSVPGRQAASTSRSATPAVNPSPPRTLRPRPSAPTPRRASRALRSSRPRASRRSSVRSDHPRDLAASSRVRPSRWHRINGARSRAGSRFNSSSNRPRSSRQATSANGSEVPAGSPTGGACPPALRLAATPHRDAVQPGAERRGVPNGPRPHGQCEEGRLKRVVGVGAGPRSRRQTPSTVGPCRCTMASRAAASPRRKRSTSPASAGCSVPTRTILASRIPGARHVGLRELDDRSAATNASPANFLSLGDRSRGGGTAERIQVLCRVLEVLGCRTRGAVLRSPPRQVTLPHRISKDPTRASRPAVVPQQHPGRRLHARRQEQVDAAGRGRLQARRAPRVRREDRPTPCNLYVSMLLRLGLEMDKFGGSTGTLTGLEALA